MTDVLTEVGRGCGMEMSVWGGRGTQIMKISRQPFPLQIVINQKRQENAEYFNSLVSMITYDARCTREINGKKGGFQHEN